jgi:UDP-N-acetylglucosamine--N-acetylmuramyl-(pentapeptide) pyrophosphoryl-undecaprenol N-acetylglucosamine transferase
MRVLLAAGGTGGHINPALAIAEIVKKRVPNAEFLFAGTPNGMESELIPKAGYNFAEIKVSGFQRKLTPKNIKRNVDAVGHLLTADRRSGEIIKGFQPDIVIGTGGYVSGPILRKAAKMGIPTVIHEANAFPGVTTKILSKLVDRVMLTVEEAKEYLDKTVQWEVTGLPVRSGITKKTKAEARRELGFDDNLCILSFGGSLGAGKINETMCDVIEWHTKNALEINHIHGFGGNGKATADRKGFVETLEENGVDIKSKRLKISEYIHDMPTCMAAADLVICRSGASTLAELEAAGKASILIPSPIVAGNHQFYNAKVLEKAGGAVLIEQKDVTSDLMISTIKDFYEQPNHLKTMSKNTAALNIPDVDERIMRIIRSVL